jgi:translation elongation factor EF-Tu-like GTPase
MTPDFDGMTYRARLRVLPADESGRHAPIQTGYRCEFWLGVVQEGTRVHNDAAIYLEDPRTELAPGAEGTVLIVPVVPESWTHLRPGDEVQLQEGDHVVGIATIMEIT